MYASSTSRGQSGYDVFGVAGGTIKSREEAPNWVIDLGSCQMGSQWLRSIPYDLPNTKEERPVDSFSNLFGDKIIRLVVIALI